MKLVQLLAAALLALLAAGCPSQTHCQSGAKHGTQCYDHESGYTTNDSRDDESERSDRDEPPPSTTPRWK